MPGDTHSTQKSSDEAVFAVTEMKSLIDQEWEAHLNLTMTPGGEQGLWRSLLAARNSRKHNAYLH